MGSVGTWGLGSAGGSRQVGRVTCVHRSPWVLSGLATAWVISGLLGPGQGDSWWPERVGTVDPGVGAASSVFEVSGDPSESPVPTPLSQDCLRACQEQIEALLESSLRQAQQQNLDPKAAEEEEEEEEVDLACTPTDVRDVNI